MSKENAAISYNDNNISDLNDMVFCLITYLFPL